MDCLDDARPCLEKQRATLANVKERRIEAGDTILKHTSTNAIIDPLVTGEYMQANLLQRQSLEKIKIQIITLPLSVIKSSYLN